MKSLKSMLLAAVALLALVVASSASATTITPQNTAFDGTSPHGVLTIGNQTVTCTHSVASGTTPSGSATTVSAPISLSYSGCNAYGFGATVTVATTPGGSTPCTGASSLTLGVMYNSASSITANVHIPSGCYITVKVPSLLCQAVVDGTQNIPGTVTNGPPAKLHFVNAPVNVTGAGSCGGGAGTLSTTYTITDPTNLVVEA